MSLNNYQLASRGIVDSPSGTIWNSVLNRSDNFSYTVPANATGDLNISFDFVEAQVVWRIFNPATGEHMFTPSKDEYDANRNSIFGTRWNGEGIAWIAPKTGQPVYRLYNANYDRQGLCSHFFTANKSEAENPSNVAAGWRYDNLGEPLFYSGGDAVIYHARNDLQKLSHHYTSDFNEYWFLWHTSDPAYRGWDGEADRNAIFGANGNIVGWNGIFKALM